MTDQITAYCGLICNDCQSFFATRDNDTDKLKTLAMEWYRVEDDPTFCLCDDAMSMAERLPTVRNAASAHAPYRMELITVHTALSMAAER